jgi:hypothetical protein
MDIKALDRITLRGFQEKDIVNVVEHNGSLYCIDDPLLLEKAKGYNIVAKVNNEKELWKYYLDNNIRNCLDPFKLLMLYKRSIITKEMLPEKIVVILEASKEIEDNILDEFEEYVREQEKNRSILLHITILLAIKEAVEKLKTNNLATSIKDLVHDLTNTYSSITHIPNPKGLLSYIEQIIVSKEEEEERREWEEYKERKEEEIKGVLKHASANVVVKNVDIKDEFEAQEPTFGEPISIEEQYKPLEEGYKRVRLEVEFVYPEDREHILLEFIKKTKKSIENFCRRYGIAIGGMD